jgi:arsenate reductase-like glutaredoxin family protein
MARHPKIMERPIVVRGSEARLGRPTESIFELFED